MSPEIPLGWGPSGVRTLILVPWTPFGTLPLGAAVALTPGYVGKRLPQSRCCGARPP